MTKVLIVDDHPEMCAVLRRMAELLGFTAIVADNGPDGVKRAVAEKPDVILVDLIMPQMDGCELTHTLRITAETRNIPIIAVTASADEGDLNACIHAGCNGYLVKPFTLDEMQQKIAEVSRAPA